MKTLIMAAKETRVHSACCHCDADEYVQFTPSDHYTRPLPILDKRRLHSLNETFDITQWQPPSNGLVIFCSGEVILMTS